MNILHILDGYGGVLEGGSVQTVVYNLAKRMAESGNNVTILERKHGEDPLVEKRHDINIVRLRTGARVSHPWEAIKNLPFDTIYFAIDAVEFAIKANRWLKKRDYDVIHIHLPFATSILTVINRKLRSKMIYTAHIGEENKRLNLNGSAPLPLKLFSPDLYLMKRVRKNVVLNEPLKGKLVEKGISEDRLEVIHNGVDVESFNLSEEEVERVREKYGFGDYVTVMFSGTVTPRKGVEHLIKAGEMLSDDNVLFLVVGNTKLDKEYAERVMDYGRKKEINAKFTGFVPYEDLVGLYSACDIFVLPSFEEGDPIALKEALASGKPLIG